MLKLSLLDIILRSIPEEFLLIFAIYAFSKTTINIKRYLVSSLLLVFIVYLIRLLPIQFGVHTILILIVVIFLTVYVNKIYIIKSIQASIIAMIVEAISEGINIFIIQYIFKLDVNNVFKEPTLKILYGIPSLFIFAIVITIYYFRSFRRRELRDVFNGEISK